MNGTPRDPQASRRARIARADRLLARARKLSRSDHAADRQRALELFARVRDDMASLMRELEASNPVLALLVSSTLPRC